MRDYPPQCRALSEGRTAVTRHALPGFAWPNTQTSHSNDSQGRGREMKRVVEKNTAEKMMAKESTERRMEEETTGVGARNGVRRRVECTRRGRSCKSWNWRPSLKQRGLFSVRDPSQETQLENRLNRLSKLLADIAQHECKRHVNKVCYAGLWLWLLL